MNFHIHFYKALNIYMSKGAFIYDLPLRLSYINFDLDLTDHLIPKEVEIEKNKC
jgi:hypothetical protein